MGNEMNAYQKSLVVLVLVTGLNIWTAGMMAIQRAESENLRQKIIVQISLLEEKAEELRIICSGGA